MVWKLYALDDTYLKPLEYSTGKTQENIVNEVIEALQKYDILFLKGGVGTGKSPISLHLINHYGSGIIVTPTKILERQYSNDYSKRLCIKNEEDKNLEIFHVMGKNNFKCLLYPELNAGDKQTPCSRQLEKNESRIQVASQCPYWSPVYSSTFIKENLKQRFEDYDFINYDSITDEKTFIKAEEPCSYYKQFSYFTKPCALIFNLAKWEIETWIGRKPKVPIEIIDEGDTFLDELNYRVSLSKQSFDSLRKEGLASKVQIKIVEFAFEELINHLQNYNYFINEQIADFISYFIESFSGVSTSGRLCSMINKAKVIYRNWKVSWAKIYRRRLTVFIPRPDITLKEIQKRCGKLLLMSATLHSNFVLSNIFGVKNAPIIEAETRFPGTLIICKTGLETKVNMKLWNEPNFREQYKINLSKVLSIAKKPCLVQVHAFKYVPEKFLKEINVMGNEVMWSTITDRGIDLPDEKCRSIVILKYPYPDLSDVILQTMHKLLGELFWSYYQDMANRNLIQQCGRAIRHKDDWCEVYSLDKAVIQNLPYRWKGKYVISDRKI